MEKCEECKARRKKKVRQVDKIPMMIVSSTKQEDSWHGRA